LTPLPTADARWHKGGPRCPTNDSICFYGGRHFSVLLGWSTPPACVGTFSGGLAEVIRSIQHTRCDFYLQSCPGDCWTDRMPPHTDNDAVTAPTEIEHIRLGGA